MGADVHTAIPFSRPTIVGTEQEYVRTALEAGVAESGQFGRRCREWLEQRMEGYTALLTPSCTHALELAALLLDIGPGDEIIMPSFTFVSTASAFVLRGATPVFVDIDPKTLNIDPFQVRQAVTSSTRAIVAVHYAGNACDMETLSGIAAEYGLYLIEDAAQGIGATYRGRPLGGLADIGCISFHYTKNLQCGEGGAILIRDQELASRAEIIRDKGTNRSRFLRREIHRYTWVDIGSSYVLSELNCAMLYAQLEAESEITGRRRTLWGRYRQLLMTMPAGWRLLGTQPEACPNGHITGLLAPEPSEAAKLLDSLKRIGIHATSHYVPLHDSPAGRKFGRCHGDLKQTEQLSTRLVRLPMFFGLGPADVDYIASKVLQLTRVYQNA